MKMLSVVERKQDFPIQQSWLDTVIGAYWNTAAWPDVVGLGAKETNQCLYNRTIYTMVYIYPLFFVR
jgi:hypothetical protein